MMYVWMHVWMHVGMHDVCMDVCLHMLLVALHASVFTRAHAHMSVSIRRKVDRKDGSWGYAGWEMARRIDRWWMDK